MSRIQRARGLLGTMITWGIVGALVGVSMFVVRYQPWQASGAQWRRVFELLGMFAGVGAAWGAACGLAFGLVLWRTAGRLRFEQLTSRRFVLWGALAGAAFPGLLYGAFVLRTGFYDAVPLYATLTGISALLGAGFGRIVFAVAKRAPELTVDPPVLGSASGARDPAMQHQARERAH